MSERHGFTFEVAEQIRNSILEYQECFTPHIFEDVIIVGGIRKKGHSDHDIDVAILWQAKLGREKQRILRHLIQWLRKEYGSLIDSLDIYSYIPHKASSFMGKDVSGEKKE